jgi:excisionase family DNA binding protein
MNDQERSQELRKLMTAREVAALLSISRASLTREIQRGRLSCYRCGTKLLFDAGQVRAYLERIAQPAKAA